MKKMPDGPVSITATYVPGTTVIFDPNGGSCSRYNDIAYDGKLTSLPTAKWKKQSTKMGTGTITGYQVRYSTKSSMASAKTKTVKGYAKTSLKIGSLKAKTKYCVQVRTYMTVNGVKYYSAWSAKKTVTTK